MKYKLPKEILLSCMIFFILACNPKKEAPVSTTAIDKEQIKKEIQAKENEFADLINSGELKNIGYYAEDATSFAQNRSPLVGKQAIVDFYKAGMDSSSKGSKISFTTNEVFVSNDGNQVLEVGYYKWVDTANISFNSGNYMVLFEKRDGSYFSVREMSVSDIPFD